MDIHLTKIWCSPSTLHLRLMATFKTNDWHQYADLHIPLDKIPADAKTALLLHLSEMPEGLVDDEPLPFG